MPRGKRINWESYDSMILKEIRETPENIKFACMRVASKTGLSYYSIKNRWYNVLSLRRADYSFFTMSSRKTVVSRKNTYAGTLRQGIKKTPNSGLSFVRSFIRSVKRHFS